jgi:hypothetical protein
MVPSPVIRNNVEVSPCIQDGDFGDVHMMKNARLWPVLLALQLGCAGAAQDQPSGTGGETGEAGKAGPTGGSAGSGGTGGSTGGSGPSPADASAPGGMGGQLPPDAEAPHDSSSPGPDSRSPADARTSNDASPARPSNPDLDKRCTVPVTFANKVPTSMGGMIFNREIPDAVAKSQEHSRIICNILYRKPEEVRNVTRQGLTIDTDSGVAFTVGGNITFSSDYIASFSSGKNTAAIDFELNGVMVHEGTHIWQYANGGGWLVEAMADYVRYKAGFDKLSRRRPGGNWNQPYTVGGFFIAWIDEKYDPDFGYKVNMGMKNQGFDYAALVKQITGKDVDTAWAEYQAAIK